MLLQIPEWRAAAATIIIAALSWSGKKIWDWRSAVLEIKKARQAKLVELYSLLRAGRVSYEIQKEHRSKLLELIGKNHNSMGHGIWNLVTSSGNDREWDGVGKECIQENPMEEIISESFFYLYPSEKDLHYIIRGITINAILPVNEALQEWLKNDNYFKGQLNRRDIYGKLALNLADLEAHLLLWRAKFEVWIPDNPERAIVYMYDENRHGVPFPPELENIVKELLIKKGMVAALANQ